MKELVVCPVGCEDPPDLSALHYLHIETLNTTQCGVVRVVASVIDVGVRRCTFSYDMPTSSNPIP